MASSRTACIIRKRSAPSLSTFDRPTRMSQVASVNGKSASPYSLVSHVERVRSQFAPLIEKHGNDRIRSLWPDWDARLRQIQERSRERPEVAISLVGGTGAGKSTL